VYSRRRQKQKIIAEVRSRSLGQKTRAELIRRSLQQKFVTQVGSRSRKDKNSENLPVLCLDMESATAQRLSVES
jgi:hypothetical protein